MVCNHEQTGTVAPSENGRLPPVLAHQLASAYKKCRSRTQSSSVSPHECKVSEMGQRYSRRTVRDSSILARPVDDPLKCLPSRPPTTLELFSENRGDGRLGSDGASVPPDPLCDEASRSPKTEGRPLRVVHVASQMVTGGMEKLLVEFARHADRSRFDLRFVALVLGGALRMISSGAAGQLPPCRSAGTEATPGVPSGRTSEGLGCGCRARTQ